MNENDSPSPATSPDNDPDLKAANQAEDTLWKGSPSQIRNLTTWIICGVVTIVILALAIILPITFPWSLILVPVIGVWAFWQWLQVKMEVYELTNQRLKVSTGVLNTVTEELELYRVKDIQRYQSLLYRMYGVETIRMMTTDASTPEVIIDAIPATVKLPDMLRRNVEVRRELKRTRELDVE